MSRCGGGGEAYMHVMCGMCGTAQQQGEGIDDNDGDAPPDAGTCGGVGGVGGAVLGLPHT